MGTPVRDPSPFNAPVYTGRDFAAAIAATGTFAIGTPHSTRKFRVEYAELIVDTTYAADPANFYAFTLQVGGTVVASWSTQSTAQGALTAATPGAMVLSATDANTVVAPGGVLTLVATKNGTAVNITPCINVRGEFVS